MRFNSVKGPLEGGNTVFTALDVLAENNFGDTRTGGLAGPLGLLVVVLLGAATVFLIRNMNARLRRLPDRFAGQDDDAALDRGHPAAREGQSTAREGRPTGRDRTD